LEVYMLVSGAGRIEAIGSELIDMSESAEVIDCSGMLVLPGFIDVHVHGGGGFDMLQATFEGLDGMSRFHAQHGKTSFLATSSTTGMERIERALRNAAEAVG
jgi:N-acetylglucosamine-6-phosphate deacetylase